MGLIVGQSPRQHHARQATRPALRIALIYAAIGAAWILVSDSLGHRLFPPDQHVLVQHVKGWLFVAATAGLLYLLVYRSLSRLVEAQRQREEAQEHFRRAFEDAVVGMAMFDDDGRFLRVNPMLCAMLGRDESQLQRMSVLEVTHPDDRPRRREMLRRLREGGPNPGPFQIRYLKADGSVVHGLASSTLCRGADGRPLYWLSQIVDITQRHEAEQRLREQEQQWIHASRLVTLGQMAAGLAHDLSQPLGAMLSYTQTCLDLLRRGQGEPDERTAAVIRALEEVEREAELTRQIVERLRSLSRRQSPAPRPLDPNATIRDTARLLLPEAERRRIRLDLKLDPAAPTIRADPVQFQQVVMNLIHNALDAADDAGPLQRRVEVATRRVNGDAPAAVQISVDDAGAGPADAVRDHMYEPFVTTKPRGVGLGLSVCRTIVEQHGGRLWHERRDDHTSFHIELPAQQENDRARTAPDDLAGR